MNCNTTFNWFVNDNQPGFVWITYQVVISDHVMVELPVVKGNVNIPVGDGYSVVQES